MIETNKASIRDYVADHTMRGDCDCGKCIESTGSTEAMPNHTVDLVFFKVANDPNNPADAETLRTLIKEHRGEFNDVDLFDGNKHNYMEVGGWIGDQGLALQLMGLGAILGLWKLITPMSLGITGDNAMQMAGMGMLSILACD